MAKPDHQPLLPPDLSFGALADSIPQLVWAADATGALSFVNRRWSDYTGVAAADARGAGWLDAIHADERALVASRWQAAVAAGKPGELEARLTGRDGACRWFLLRFEPYRDVAGTVACWFGTATDVDRQKRRSDAAREYTEARYRQLVETADEGIMEIDLEGRIRYLNARMAAMLGYTPADMRGRSIFDFIFEADRMAARRHMADRKRGVRRSFEWRWRRRDGAEAWTWVGAAPLIGPDGETFGAVGVFSDLAERRAAAEVRRASEERLRTSVDCLLDCFAIFTALRDPSGAITDFRIEHVNAAVCAANDLARDDLVGRSLLEVRPANRTSGLFDAYCRVVETGEPLSREMEFLAGGFGGRSGGRWLDIRASRLGDGFVVAWRDVTERKLLENSFRELADTAPALLWETDATGTCTFLSRAWAEFTGQPVAEGLGSGWTAMVHPADVAATLAALADATARPSEFQVELRLQRPEGGYRWIIGAGRPRFDAEGGFKGFAGSIVDIDANKRGEEKLRESEERMRLAAEVAQVGAFEWNLKTFESMLTPELEAIYGLPPGGMVNNYAAWRERVHAEDIDAVEQRIQAAIADGEFAGEWRVVRPDGTLRWVEARGRVYKDADGEPVKMLGVNFDITDRKHAEEALREEAQRKDAFLAALAHELRNPLGPVRNAAAILARVGPGDGPEFSHATRVIERQVAHMARLTDDLLDVSRIVRGSIQLQRETLDLVQVVRRTAEDYRPMLEAESGLTLTLDLPCAPVWVDGDEVRLTQALGNLLHNAAKFTARGGAVQVRASADGAGATVAVADTGRGMTAAMRRRLFEPFSQADESLDRSQGGLGLGLALVKGLTVLHGGSVEAASDGPGRGSTFTLRLPVVAAPAVTSGAASAAKPSARGRRVLIIEDNADAAASLAMLLELDGHDVAVAPDGQSGLDAVRQSPPDVVLCDIGLPGGIDGFDVARALKADAALPPFRLVALTGYGQEEDRQRAAEAGFDRHLLKPVDLAELHRVLQGA